MQNLDFSELVRAVIMLASLIIVGAIAYFGHNDAALGALLILVGLGGQFFYHSKVQIVNADGSTQTITPNARILPPV